MPPSKRSMPFYLKSGLSLAVLALVAGYAWIAYRPEAQPGRTLVPVTIAANVAYAGSCPVFAALEKGYFKNEGLSPSIQPHSSGKAALAAVLRGEANLATVGDLPVMFAAVNGQPVTVLANIFSSEEDFGVVGKKDSGIATPAGLRGKRIGVTFGTGGHFYITSFLLREKLSVSDVSLVDLKLEDMADALSRGSVDAVSVWEPFLGSLRAGLGSNALTFSGKGIYGGLFTLAGERDYVAANPETMKKVLRALIMGATFCQDSPEAAIEITARSMKADPAMLKRHWPLYRFEITLDQALILALEDESRWAIKNKLTERTGEVNFLDHVYIDGLKAIAPASVTVIY